MSGEFAFIERLRAALPAPPVGEVWIGDDAAVLTGGLVLAIDAMVDGVHADRRWSTASDFGWKALAVNCSDLAAMGASPSAAVAAVVLPPGEDGLADELLAGLAEAAAAFGCPLVGGDTTAGPALVVTVAVTGYAPPVGAVLRSGARPGDAIFVTGPLGGAKAALDAHRVGAVPSAGLQARMARPWPRIRHGAVAAAAGATAMIDISDGFAADLGHILAASRCGARVVSSCVPVEVGAVLDDALFGGDDYELCFTARDRDAVQAGFAAADLPPPIAVGECVDGEGCVLATASGERPLVLRGWEHEVR